jgi:hypothetical protein
MSARDARDGGRGVVPGGGRFWRADERLRWAHFCALVARPSDVGNCWPWLGCDEALG